MKRYVFAAILGIMCSAAQAQQVPIPPTQNTDTLYGRSFDPNRIVTVNGQVTGMVITAGSRTSDRAIVVTVKTERGPSTVVDLGPAWYVEASGSNLNVGDRISVTGSNVVLEGASSIVATHIVSGNRLLALRGAEGGPLWVNAQRPVYTQAPAVPVREVVTVVPIGSGYEPSRTLLGGQIVRIGEVLDPRTGEQQVAVMIDTGLEVRPVILGPAWYLASQNMNINLGQIIRVDAWQTSPYSDGPLYARRVAFGRDSVALRTVQGGPLWMSYSDLAY